VDARPLDMFSSVARRNLDDRGTNTTIDSEDPVLLASTLASTRGLDFPNISHVFAMGVPESRVDSYTHIAERTGRFGKIGKIAAVV